MSKGKTLNWKTMLGTMGAFISYTVGAGFASGNEVLQFYGSWGIPQGLYGLIGGLIVTAIYAVCLYMVGSKVQFEKTSDSYEFFGGRILGKFFKVFVFIFVFGSFMLMFIGAGTLLNQQFNLPQWAGTIIMAIVSGVVVLGGLKTVETVLGSAGIIILAYVAIFTLISFFSPSSSLDQAANIDQAVAQGIVYQADVFDTFPVSLLGIDYNSFWLSGLLYGALCVVSGFPFYLTLGKRAESLEEAKASGILTAVGYFLCIFCLVLLMLMNFNSIINPRTGQMYDFPAAAAVSSLWPAGGWTYTIVIFAGIFTSTTGYLWVLIDWFLPGSEGTSKFKIAIVVLLIVGMALGNILPFSALINFLFPLTGLAGLLMTATFLYRVLDIRKKPEKYAHIKGLEKQEHAEVPGGEDLG